MALGLGILLAAGSALFCQNQPSSNLPDEMAQIKARLTQLDESLAALRKQSVTDPYLAEAEVFHKAVAWAVQQQQLKRPEARRWALEAIEQGLLRTKLEAANQAPWLVETGRSVVMGYRSQVDGSVQPYIVTRPADYGKDLTKTYRTDVVLHGRDPNLTEVKFLHQYGQGKAEGDVIRLDIYGRGNNGYRWAGETDVIEAVTDFVAVERAMGRYRLLDPNRVVLRGFSMGGAGTWSIGLHYPSRWCVLGPGAGFTTTHGYVKNLPPKLPDYQEQCLTIYDAADYAENVFDVPVVAYAGADDPQLQAARTIQERIKPLGLNITLLIAPGLKHQFPPAWQQKAEADYERYAGPDKGRDPYPRHVRFVTYTTKYPICAWVEVIGMGRHYEKASVDATRTEDGFTVKTTNVTALKFGLPGGATQPQTVNIDGQTVAARPRLIPVGEGFLYLEKVGDHWQAVLPEKLITARVRRPQKTSGLQGPIDDVFTARFLCVRGTGTPWHEATGRYAEANLERFQHEWARYFHGQLPVKDDVSVTDQDIASRHLILFGDPASNSVIAQVLDGLPLQWTEDRIQFAGKTYNAADHVPVMVYPSPLNPQRLVVLNSGHTFHARDFEATNAMLFPRLGDYAILELATTETDPLAVRVATAGIFDEFWHVNKDKHP